MRLLLDANLSWRMINTLKEHFNDCFHVDNISIKAPAKDVDIWNYAKANELTIVTNDEDFVDLVGLKGFPPKVILLKTGNQSRLYLTNLLIFRKDEIKHFYNSPDLGLFEIVDKKS
jgi:predicted nuclease of predicted toxin-antitoxin system